MGGGGVFFCFIFKKLVCYAVRVYMYVCMCVSAAAVEFGVLGVIVRSAKKHRVCRGVSSQVLANGHNPTRARQSTTINSTEKRFCRLGLLLLRVGVQQAAHSLVSGCISCPGTRVRRLFIILFYFPLVRAWHRSTFRDERPWPPPLLYLIVGGSRANLPAVALPVVYISAPPFPTPTLRVRRPSTVGLPAYQQE